MLEEYPGQSHTHTDSSLFLLLFAHLIKSWFCLNISKTCLNFTDDSHFRLRKKILDCRLWPLEIMRQKAGDAKLVRWFWIACFPVSQPGVHRVITVCVFFRVCVCSNLRKTRRSPFMVWCSWMWGGCCILVSAASEERTASNRSLKLKWWKRSQPCQHNAFFMFHYLIIFDWYSKKDLWSVCLLGKITKKPQTTLIVILLSLCWSTVSCVLVL